MAHTNYISSWEWKSCEANVSKIKFGNSEGFTHKFSFFFADGEARAKKRLFRLLCLERHGEKFEWKVFPVLEALLVVYERQLEGRLCSMKQFSPILPVPTTERE